MYAGIFIVESKRNFKITATFCSLNNWYFVKELVKEVFIR